MTESRLELSVDPMQSRGMKAKTHCISRRDFLRDLSRAGAGATVLSCTRIRCLTPTPLEVGEKTARKLFCLLAERGQYL